MSASHNNWVVVSGAGGALGREIAKYYEGLGRRVLALDQRFDPAYSATSRVKTRTLDLLSEYEVGLAITETLDRTDGVSLLVNAVGLIWNEPLLAMRGAKFTTHSSESWHRVIDANLTAPFIVATQVAARMARRGGGAIVNFSSVASEGNVGQAAYSAAKAGIEGLTRAMAAELGPIGVRVNAVALGFIDVATTRNAVTEDMLQQYATKTPLGRLGHVEDVIGAIEFLAGNTFINGAVVKIDGGIRL
jgi:3-oxoacyl-[acyl-carrier protein] reductase